MPRPELYPGVTDQDEDKREGRGGVVRIMGALTCRSEVLIREVKVRRAAGAQEAKPRRAVWRARDTRWLLKPPTRSLREDGASAVWAAIPQSLLPAPQLLPLPCLHPSGSPQAISVVLSPRPLSFPLPACRRGMVWASGNDPTSVSGSQPTLFCPQAPGSGVQL